MTRKKPLSSLLGSRSKFGRLRVLCEATTGNGRRRVTCLCECGNECIVHVSNLTRGLTKSCGCFRREFTTASKTKHGGKSSREYETWKRIIQRTTNSKRPDFHLYGARGIRVCERWRSSFSAFLQDMGQRPSDTHSIDRYPDNDGNYEPGNCRWALPGEQAANTRSVRWITINGQKVTLTRAASEIGVAQATLSKRIAAGWPESRWLDPPRRVRPTTRRTGK